MTKHFIHFIGTQNMQPENKDDALLTVRNPLPSKCCFFCENELCFFACAKDNPFNLEITGFKM